MECMGSFRPSYCETAVTFEEKGICEFGSHYNDRNERIVSLLKLKEFE